MINYLIVVRISLIPPPQRYKHFQTYLMIVFSLFGIALSLQLNGGWGGKIYIIKYYNNNKKKNYKHLSCRRKKEAFLDSLKDQPALKTCLMRLVT